MTEIKMPEVSKEFARCWHAAGRHLQAHMQGASSWLRASLKPPFLEHLSFRLGNQIFFVRIEDEHGEVRVPGSRDGLRLIADSCKGHACIMRMRNRGGSWVPCDSGWGLVDARTGSLVDPSALVSDERVEMTEWELQDFAVQIVRDYLDESGRQLMSWQGNPAVDPSIWFVGDAGPEWVVVRAVRYPTVDASPPSNWQQIAQCCAALSPTGHFASVSVANGDDAFDPSGTVPPEPLWRGHALTARFEGLVSVSPHGA